MPGLALWSNNSCLWSIQYSEVTCACHQQVLVHKDNTQKPKLASSLKLEASCNLYYNNHKQVLSELHLALKTKLHLILLPTLFCFKSKSSFFLCSKCTVQLQKITITCIGWFSNNYILFVFTIAPASLNVTVQEVVVRLGLLLYSYH